jgi:hypothetical protein
MEFDFGFSYRQFLAKKNGTFFSPFLPIIGGNLKNPSYLFREGRGRGGRRGGRSDEITYKRQGDALGGRTYKVI